MKIRMLHKFQILRPSLLFTYYVKSASLLSLFRTKNHTKRTCSASFFLFCFYREDIQGLQKCVNVEPHVQCSEHTLFPPVRLCPGSLSTPVPLLCLFAHPRLKVHLLQKQLLHQLSAHKAKSPSWFSRQQGLSAQHILGLDYITR